MWRPAGQKLILAPRALPIALAEAEENFRLVADSDDGPLERAIRGAVIRAEAVTGRMLVLQQWEAYYDFGFPRVIELPHVPLREVNSITYVDTDGATQTVSTDTYTVDRDSEPGRIYEAYNESWPTVRSVRKAVTVKYTAGYLVPFLDADVTTGTDTITATDHPLANGDTTPVSNSGGTLPAGLSADTPYYAVGVSGNDLQLSLSSGGSAVDITAAAGGGTHFLGRLPDGLRAALLLMAGALYEHREQIVRGTDAAALPGIMAAEQLLADERVFWV